MNVGLIAAPAILFPAAARLSECLSAQRKPLGRLAAAKSGDRRICG